MVPIGGESGIVSATPERPAAPDRDMRQSYPSPAAAITVDVLLKLSAIAPEATGIRKLSRMLGVPRSTVHRVLSTLEMKGMVRRVGTASYTVGDGVGRLGVQYRMLELPRLAQPILEDVHRQLGETVNLAVPAGEAMVIVATMQSSEPLRMVSWVGRHDMMHASALGKAYLAALPDAELGRVLRQLSLVRLTPNTLVRMDALRRDLYSVRRRGFAIDDGESVVGVRCVGAAIRDGSGRPVAALSVSTPVARLPDEKLPTVGRVVMHGAAGITVLLDRWPWTSASTVAIEVKPSGPEPP